MKIKKNTRKNLVTLLMVAAAYFLIVIADAAGFVSDVLSGQLVPICAYIMMALSLNLTVGILGELSLGHAGFMSIGAFTGATVSMSLTGAVESGVLRFIIAAVAGAVVAALLGFLIGLPVLRLKGDYLAIVTLAFGEIIKSIINCLYIGSDSSGIHFSLKSAEALGLAEGGKVIVNGPMGAVGIKKLSTFTAGAILVVITLLVIFMLVDSRAGRAIMAIRDNRIAAESVGIPITKYKMTAFIISAAIAGAAGVLYGLGFSTVTASKFNYNTSILVLLFVVLGGIGSMRGSVISAAFLTILPELLREFRDYRMLIYAIVLILVMIFTNNATMRAFMIKVFDAVLSVPRRMLRKKSKEGVSDEQNG